jgi:hypothetical protein
VSCFLWRPLGALRMRGEIIEDEDDGIFERTRMVDTCRQWLILHARRAVSHREVSHRNSVVASPAQKFLIIPPGYPSRILPGRLPGIATLSADTPGIGPSHRNLSII